MQSIKIRCDPESNRGGIHWSLGQTVKAESSTLPGLIRTYSTRGTKPSHLSKKYIPGKALLQLD